MKLLNKIKLDLTLIWHSLFYAMRAGDNELSQTAVNGHDSEVNHHLTVAGAMQDLIQGEETEQVKEIRDEYYRILEEADKYHVDVQFSVNEDGDVTGEMSATARKKTSADYSQHANVYEGDGYKLRVIQDNKLYEKNSFFANSASDVSSMTFDSFDGIPLIDLDWGDVIPRYTLDKFATKVVVKTVNNQDAIVELYCPTIAGQFTKKDAIFIAELNRLFNDKEYKSDLKNLFGLRFITDKAWNSESLREFKFDNMQFKDIFVYDGHFILSYKARTVIDGVSVTEKYKTDELTKKYENNAPKKDATDIFAIERQINGIDFGENRIKITNENSN